MSANAVRKYSATLCLFGLALAFKTTATAQEFGYHDPVGPNSWCTLSPSNVACCGGTGEQSPVNILTADALREKHLPQLKFRYPGNTSLSVVHNGHTVQANVPAGATLELDGLVYNLLQFHFHTPSEHTVNYVHAPIEMHLVHKTSDGLHTAVVAVFVLPGKEHKELEKIWTNLPEKEGAETVVAKFSLHQLLPPKENTYRYGGSLTTPPCTEGVSWNLFADNITMSEDQIGKFQGIFSGADFPMGNARPVQPIGRREILTDAK